MAFPSEIDGLVITRDSRAQARGKGTPAKITVTHKAGSRAEVLRTAFSAKTPPFALVDTYGNVHIVSAGGGIWTHGEGSDAQDDAVELLKQAMIEAFDIEAKPKKKAAAKKAVTVKIEQGVERLAEVTDGSPEWDQPRTAWTIETPVDPEAEELSKQAWTSYGVGPDPF